MITAELITTDLKPVTHVQLLPFINGLPDVLLWEDRTFVRADAHDTTDRPAYREAFMWVIPAQG